MARLNIEDSLFKDHAFMELVALTGNRWVAMGMVMEGFMLAQKFYFDEEHDRCIPLKDFQRCKLEPLIAVGMAEQLPHGVRMRGSKKAFAWLVQKVNAGKSSAAARAKGPKTPKKKTQVNAATTALNEASTTVNGAQPLSLSPSLTPPLVQDLVPAPKGSKRARNKLTADEQNLNKAIWIAYSQAYAKRYKLEPLRNAMINGQINNLRKKLGKDAVPVAHFFVCHNKSYYVGKTHTFGLCLQDAETLHTQWRKGRTITEGDIKNFEKRSQEQSQIERLESGDL